MTPVPQVPNWLQLPTLRLLVAVADTGSLTAGARSVGMAQSNASRALATLERRLGYPLIERSHRGSRLTDKGSLTVEWAREVILATERLLTGAATLAADRSGDLPVGASMTVAEYLAPGWVSELRSELPEITTSLHVANSHDVIEAVRSGAVPIGFIESPDAPSEVNSIEILPDRLVLVTSPVHPWARAGRPIEVDELSRTALVEREPGSGTRAALDAAIGAERPRPVAELNSNAAICGSVAAGLGPAVLSSLAVREAIASGRLVPIEVTGDPLRRSFRGIWHGPRPTGPAGRLLQIALASNPPD